MFKGVKPLLWSLLAAFFISLTAFGQQQTLSLKPFATQLSFDDLDCDWLLPRGRHVYDGVPFQIDGVISLYAKNSAQYQKPGPTNLSGIEVNQRFEDLHLLAAAQGTESDGTVIANINLEYVDGTTNKLPIRFGNGVRPFRGQWHQKGKPLRNRHAHQAWHAQASAAAASDTYLRLFHLPMTNPEPAKIVRHISLQSTKSKAGLVVAAITVGPRNVTAETNDPLGTAPFPDLRPRHGDLATGGGVVRDREGKPIANAYVRIEAARAVTNSSWSATRQHPAVGMEQLTKPDGSFEFQLPDDRVYHVLVGADDFECTVYRGMDPKSDPIEVRLTRAKTVTLPHVASARIIQANGAPVPWALVEINYLTDAFSGGSIPRPYDMPGETVTDKNGRFAFSSSNEFYQLDLQVHRGRMAPLEFKLGTNLVPQMEMGTGATVVGRILSIDRQPVSGITLGLAGAIDTRTAATATNGTFCFSNVVAGKTIYLFGINSSCKKFGAIVPLSFQSAAHGQTNDLGDVQFIRGLHLAGRVQMRHGERLPKSIKLYVWQANEEHSCEAIADTNGSFRFDGLHSGLMSITGRGDGWMISPINRSTEINRANDWLQGRFEQNKDDLIIAIEPRPRGNRQDYDPTNGRLPTQDEPNSRLISGIESAPNDIVLSGTVIDDKTGLPLKTFKVVPGFQPPILSRPKTGVIAKVLDRFSKKRLAWNELPVWWNAREETMSNGFFSVDYPALSSTPILRIEATGYDPHVTEPIRSTTTNLVIRMSPANEPNGIVLSPDGKPADNATVIYAVGRKQFILTNRVLSAYDWYTPNFTMKTGVDGKFKFPHRSGAIRVFAANEQGWADEKIEGDLDKADLHLQPWCALTGFLMNSNGTPATNIELMVTMFGGSDWTSDAIANMWETHYTDARGYFLFTNLPPRRLELQRLIPRGNGKEYDLQSWLIAEPGVTNDLGKITIDTPPPRPVMEQLKKKLGLDR